MLPRFAAWWYWFAEYNHWVVRSQYTIKHYVLKTWWEVYVCISNTKWLIVNIYSCLSFKTVNATCNILNHLPTSAVYWQHTVIAVSQQSQSLSWCFLQWHPESCIIRKIILTVCLNTSCVYELFFFYCSWKVFTWCQVRYVNHKED